MEQREQKQVRVSAQGSALVTASALVLAWVSILIQVLRQAMVLVLVVALAWGLIPQEQTLAQGSQLGLAQQQAQA